MVPLEQYLIADENAEMGGGSQCRFNIDFQCSRSDGAATRTKSTNSLSKPGLHPASIVADSRAPRFWKVALLTFSGWRRLRFQPRQLSEEVCPVRDSSCWVVPRVMWHIALRRSQIAFPPMSFLHRLLSLAVRSGLVSFGLTCLRHKMGGDFMR
jgi:hypothetical protein